MNKIYRKCISVLYKIFIKIKEKEVLKGKRNLRYIFLKSKSDKLIVIFSGFSKKEVSAKYNYIRTLKGVKANKLFILDDFGYKKVGSYYLGENGEFFLEKYIIELINDIKNKCNAKNIYTIGTSKGGWAALYYGISLNAKKIISGAPQYYIGDYLSVNEYHEKILKGILGENYSEEQKLALNSKLQRRIIDYDLSNIAFVLHYSKKDPTYNKHIQYLIQDLEKKEVNLLKDVKEYEKHEEVGKFFKDCLIKNLND